jgi:hypothetical protein
VTSPADNESRIAAYLRADGLNPIATAGVLGNLQVESGFNPAAYNANEGAIGLAQWEGGRRTDGLDGLARQRGTSETDLDTQLAWLVHELNGMPGFIAQLNGQSTPEAAAALVDEDFERSAGTSRGQRQANARAALAVAQNPGAPAPSGVLPVGLGGDLKGAAGAVGGVLTAPWALGKDILGAAGNAVGGAASDALGSVAGEIGQFAANVALKLTFIGTGAVLVLLGLYRASAPARERAESAAETVAKTAAVAA